MAYIGNSPANVGNYQIIDDIKSQFDGTKTSFQLQVSAHNITPAKSGQLLVSINGVLQEPDDTGSQGFTISGTNIIFSSAPNTGAEFWGVFQGQNVDIGTPSFDTVDTVHIKDDAITDVKINSTKLDGIANNANKYIHPTSHTVSEVTGLQSALDGKVDDSQVLTNVPAGALFTDTNTVYTHPSTHPISKISGLQSALDTKTTPGYVDSAVAGIVDSAPATLHTLNELALALGDDANHVTTMTTLIGGKVSKGGDTVSGDIGFIDGAKATFGDSNDLQIYHDVGGETYIKESGSGNLNIDASHIKLRDSSGTSYLDMIDTGTGGDCYLKSGGSTKLSTTSTGIDVTGTTQTDAVEIGNGSAGGTSEILFSDNVSARGKIVYDHSASPETLILSTTGTNAIVIDNSQNVSMPNGNFDVTGSVTCDGLTVDGNLSIPNNNQLKFKYSTIAEDIYDMDSLCLRADITESIIFGRGVEESMRITPSGKVGIGTNNPREKLTIAGGNIHVDYNSTIGMSYAAGTFTDYYKGMTGTHLSSGTARGLHIFNHDVDSNGGIRFWNGRPGVGTPTEAMGITPQGNVGIGVTVPTEKLEVAGTVKADANILSAYDNVTAITGNATEIFIYDTSKDSDGGAWRKRTQHTSWYNETLNTSIRGSRKEFPAMAVIVATRTTGSDSKVTIYDGDTPDLDMWMVFVSGSNGMASRPMLQYGSENKVVAMMNGTLIVGHDTAGDNYGSPIINFISEYTYRIDPHGGEGGEWYGTIATRNANAGQVAGFRAFTSPKYIVDSRINSVAMTVLPGAPIDSTTGLPTPTIAVGTAGGVSVIMNDDTIKSDGALGLNGIAREIYFQPNTSNIFFMVNNNHHFWADVNATTLNGEEISSNPDTAIPMYWPYWTGEDKAVHTSTDRVRVHSSGVTFYKDYNEYSPTTSSVLSSVAYMTSKYNTGYMTGDIRGGWNVDTDTTTFPSMDGMTTYSLGGGATGGITGGILDVTSSSVSNECIRIPFSFVKGKFYTLTATGESGGNGMAPYGLLTTANAWANTVGSAGTTTTRIVKADYTGSSFALHGGGAYSHCVISALTIKEAVPDRARYENGMQVIGNPTVSAVATGAELKGLTNLNGTTDYVIKDFDASLDFGTGDFSCYVWLKPDASDPGDKYYHMINMTAGTQSGTGNFSLKVWSGNWMPYAYGHGGTLCNSSISLSPGSWNMIVCGRKNSTFFMYINGVDATLNPSSTSFNMGNHNLRVGSSSTNTGENIPGNIIALPRLSATAPIAKQVKEIYEAEKPMFQENAKCTLDGTSDGVKAISYDDSNEELLVGTSTNLSVFKGLRRVDENDNNISEVAQQGGLRVEEY